MNNYKHLRNVLEHHIKLLTRSRSLFCENPDTDFTRDRKITFDSVLRNVICMEGGSLNDEMLNLYSYSYDLPTSSALIQARDKIKVDAFITLFNRFNEKTHVDKLYKGYRLIAIDGSELPIDSHFSDEETTLKNCNQSHKSYSAFHLNASYDLLECTYDDLIIQGQAKMNENDAFCNLVDRYKGNKAIFIADRGYESYNGFEHVVKSGNKYLVRVKDINSKTSMTKSLGPYPGDEFDTDVKRVLTSRYTNEIKADPMKYKFCPNNLKFDYMTKENPFYEFSCRIVRFKISDDSYECIITNLDRNEFSTEEIKDLYNKRWGIETSFRELKYACNLNALHSKKRKLIKQEIYARILLHNFIQRLVQNIKVKKSNKYQYRVNFTSACHIIRQALTKTGGKVPPVDDLIVKYILPIRPGRKNTRHVKPKNVVSFNYRYN